jgi:DNA ligase-1
MPVKLADLVETSRRVSETSKRTAKTDELASLLRRLAANEIDIGVAYLSGFPLQPKTGIGYASLRDAASEPALHPTLLLTEVDQALEQIAGVSGRGSAAQRRDLLAALYLRATVPEQRFLDGLLTGELRQGALEGIMIDALAKASGAAPDRIRRAVMMAGSITSVAAVLLTEGDASLARYDVELFRPVQPMLAQTAEDVEEALDQLGEAALEYKFDGARVQVHKSAGDVIVYSRNLNDVTAAVPEVVEAVRAMPVRDVILDGEVMSFDSGGRPNPFQITMRRFGRRLNVELMRCELPVRPVWFDALYLNGGSLIDEQQRTRFRALESIAASETIAPHLFTSDRERAAEFVKQALAAGHEGVMAKSATAPYAAGARGQSWLKVKQARTLDLVILAAEWGNGRRRGWLSNLHLGARDTVNGGFAMLGKTFKGLTDEMLAWQTQEFLKIEVARDSYTVYLEPRIVAEIAFNEIQTSSRYPSGLALRFARVKRYRPDKPVSETDTFQTVQAMAGIPLTPDLLEEHLQ